MPPRIVATVLALQRIEGLSDRDAVERFQYDLRWKYACGGGLAFDHSSFVHTVLVDMRARLRRSARPNRIFEAVLDLAKIAGARDGKFSKEHFAIDLERQTVSCPAGVIV